MIRIASTILLTMLCLAAAAPTSPTSEPATQSSNPENRGRERWERMIRRVEPSGHGDPARLPQYLDFFEKEFVEDARTFAFDVDLDPSSSALRGHVEFAEHKDALESYFKQLGLPNIHDETELLPARNLGLQRFGIVTADRTFVRDRPGATARRETLTQCVRGDLVFLLKQSPDQKEFLAHAPDGYVGYITSADVRRIDETEMPKPSAKHADEIERVIAAAKGLMGTPYVWGAGTKEGTDCSGLVRCAFKAVDINLPRDADQQYLVGRLVATRWSRAGLRRGDTLYFLDRYGTIHHTALYLGDDQYIEAAHPVVKITSLRKGDPLYNEKREQSFCFGKRILE